jgi:hypothetical protein
MERMPIQECCDSFGVEGLTLTKGFEEKEEQHFRNQKKEGKP